MLDVPCTSVRCLSLNLSGSFVLVGLQIIILLLQLIDLYPYNKHRPGKGQSMTSIMVVKVINFCLLIQFAAGFTPSNVFLSPRSTPTEKGATSLQESALSSEEQRARDVFMQFDQNGSGTITANELEDMLNTLDIEATEADANALFVYLDQDGDGEIDFNDFLPWYSEAARAAMDVAESFQDLLIGRRTIDNFDQTPVQDDVLRRAIECAIAAPNRSMSEPWRFIKVGPETVQKFAELNKKIRSTMETEDGMASSLDWTKIPGWCVVTTKLSPGNPEVELEDFKSVSCAVQNFMLSMWSAGIGTKWTSGPVQKVRNQRYFFCDLFGAREFLRTSLTSFFSSLTLSPHLYCY